MASFVEHPLAAVEMPQVDWQESSPGSRVRLDPQLVGMLSRHQVYRYASIAEALGMLRGEWTFALPKLWSDKYERHTSDQLFAPTGCFGHIAIHVKCMSLEYSSEAMWRTYASKCGVVRLSVSLKELVRSLEAWVPADTKVYLARVRYMQEKAIVKAVARVGAVKGRRKSAEGALAVLMKRGGFSYENEVRISLTAESKARMGDFRSERIPVPFNKILVDPYLPIWQASELVSVLSERCPSADVKQSMFDRAPSSPEI